MPSVGKAECNPMRIKPGTRIFGINGCMAIPAVIVDDCFKKYGAELVITSGTEGRHGKRSYHYCGMAFDARTKNLPAGTDREGLLSDMRARLGPSFDVIDEDNHFHIELDLRKDF